MTVSMDPAPGEQTAERDRRLDLSVQRELARRRRLIRLYLVLLAIPLAVAAGFLLWGRTDRQVVQQEVEQRVKPVESQYREIQPMLDDVRGVSALLPEIRSVDERFQGYAQGQDELQERVAAVTSELRELKPAVAEAADLREQVQVLRRDLDRQQSDVEQRFQALAPQVGAVTHGGAAQPPAANLNPAVVGRLTDRTSRIEEQQAELSQQVRRLTAAGSEGPPSADVEALSRRIRQLERTVESLRREVEALRKEQVSY